MGKASGTTKAGSKSNPKGLTVGSVGIWKRGVDSLGSIAFSAKGAEAEELYYATQTQVEHAVESKVGDIRSGGGFSGPLEDREYTLIFRDDATKEQIQSYFKEMKTGSKLYANLQAAYRKTEEEYNKALSEYEQWYNKTNKSK